MQNTCMLSLGVLDTFKDVAVTYSPSKDTSDESGMDHKRYTITQSILEEFNMSLSIQTHFVVLKIRVWRYILTMPIRHVTAQ